MLEVGGEFFGESMGFEMNSGLFDYARECGLRVIHGGFDPVRVQGFRETNLLFSICHVLEHIENATGNLEIIHSNMERNDILYVEVPTYDGFSFQKENLSWKLWYSEHLDLWHEDTKRYIVNRLDFKLISAGRRIFAPSQMSKRKIVHDGIANLSRFLISIPSGRYEKIVNSFYGDYLWFLVGRH